MEKRAILAAVLMAALLIVYQTFFIPAPSAPPPDQQAQAPKTPAPAPGPSPAPAPPAATAPSAPSVVPPAAAAPARPAERPLQRTVPVESPLYHAVVSSEGGKLQEWTLHYRGEKPMVIVGELGPRGLVVAPAERTTATDSLPMTIGRDDVRVGPDKAADALPLTGESDGLRVQKTMRFEAGTFAYETKVRIENTSSAPRTVSVMLPWATRTDWKGVTEKFFGQHPTEVVWSTDGRVDYVDSLTAVQDREFTGAWVALGTVWYLHALVPKSPDFKVVTRAEKGTPAKPGDAPPVTHVSIAVRATPTIAPGQAWEGTVLVYIGPKEYDRLAVYGLEGTINFGGFPVPRAYGGLPMEWLGVPILQLMNWVYRHVGNYGIAIILLTLVSKVLFYPLTVKSMRSMKAMQTLQPQINALRNKYKSDPQRLQRETLDLYRKHKVNPAGGCLPMIAQIPIFYALYLALSVSVELQGATFLCFGRVPSWVPLLRGTDLWICDLANYDPTYVLPVLMGVTMFVQQKMTPVAGDPRQAKMMLVMPFVFTFMFINLPAGLVLYWTVSNVLQILQQWYMDRPAKRAATRAAKEKEIGRA
jgi:YidC/Oxa1 family membrane protein insertase